VSTRDGPQFNGIHTGSIPVGSIGQYQTSAASRPDSQHGGNAMTANTDTLTSPQETAGPETTSPPEAHPPSPSRRAALGWIAVILAGIVVTVLAVATFTGGDDPDIPAQGFYPQAEQWEREAHLAGNARTYSRAAANLDDPAGTGSPAGDTNDDEFVPGSRHMPT
jgi:hypothetical protein